MSKERLTTYNIMADLKLTVSMMLEARSLEEAIIATKTLKERDFIDILGEFIDGELKITGVFEWKQYSN